MNGQRTSLKKSAPLRPPAIWQMDPVTVGILIRLVLIGFTVGLAADLLEDGQIQPMGFFTNLSTELIGSAVTFFLLERAIHMRERQQDTEQQRAIEKARLLAHLGSRSNASALEAVKELRELGWLTDGTLRRAHLSGANLGSADLEEVILEWADLRGINFRGARLHRANLGVAHMDKAKFRGAVMTETMLQAAVLIEADMREADLTGARLEEADLYRANLQDANLSWAKLQYVDLSKTNLQGAVLYKAEFDTHTTLPDGSRWTEATDMARFTDPERSDFWRSDDPRSPAYHNGVDAHDR